MRKKREKGEKGEKERTWVLERWHCWPSKCILRYVLYKLTLSKGSANKYRGRDEVNKLTRQSADIYKRFLISTH